MRKIERIYENPIDDILISLADNVCPFFYATGHTPNMITFYSLLAGLVSLKGMYEYNFPVFAIGWTLSYFLDNVDGHFARKYNMVTKMGDMFDHIKDSILWIATFSTLYIQYQVPYSVIALFVIFGACCAKHIGCQQIHYKFKEEHDGTVETLDMYIRLCKDPESIYWTKYFGGGTVNTLLVITMWYLMQGYRFDQF